MHRYLPLFLISSSLSVLADPPAEAHPVEAATPLAAEAQAAPSAPTNLSVNAAPVIPAAPNIEANVEVPGKEATPPEAERLAKESALIAERSKRESAELRAEVDRLKLEKEYLAEKLALAELKRKSAQLEENLAFEAEQERLMKESTLAKVLAEKLTNEMKARQVEWQMETARLESEIRALETSAQRDSYANAKPEYLENPVQEDGSLVISDRRISLNGPITTATADHVTTRINYLNNKDPKLPIFIVIDDSPGGSVMSGYRILKSMEGSSAPIHVVVKSFAASMAATIATLAEHSYAYPNAIILHHQMSSRLTFANLNITEQKELYEESQKWWTRLAGPIAAKMGITTDELIKRMYERSSSGDWTEFADEALALKWIDRIVPSIRETALLKNPDAKGAAPAGQANAIHGLTEELDSEGHPVMYLPRSNPRDYYFIYNPDGYYQLR